MLLLHDMPPGQPLSSLLGNARPAEGHPLFRPASPASVDWGAVLNVTLHVCCALHALHSKGRAHGDVRAPYIWVYRGLPPQPQQHNSPSLTQASPSARGSQALPSGSNAVSRADTGSMALLQPSTTRTVASGASTAFTSVTLRGYTSIADSRASAAFERVSGVIAEQASSDTNPLATTSVTFQLASLLAGSGEMPLAPPRVFAARPTRPVMSPAGVGGTGGSTDLVVATLLWSPLCGWVRPAREQALASAHLTSHIAAIKSGGQQIAGGEAASSSGLPSSSAPVTAAGGAHVAPELHSGGPATPAGDVYALGILMWSLVNCEHAYDGEKGCWKTAWLLMVIAGNQGHVRALILKLVSHVHCNTPVVGITLHRCWYRPSSGPSLTRTPCQCAPCVPTQLPVCNQAAGADVHAAGSRPKVSTVIHV